MILPDLPPFVVIATDTALGGAAVHTLGIVRALADTGYGVTLLSSQKDLFGPYLQNTKVRYIHRPLPEDGPKARIFKLWRRALVPLSGPRVILSRCAGGCSVAILAALRSRFNRVYTIEHTMPHMGDTDTPSNGGWRWRLIRQVKARCIYRSIAVSEAVRQAFIRDLHMPPGRTRTCHGWIDTDRFRPDRAAGESIRRQLGLDQDCFVVGYVGRLSPEKRVDLIIRGFVAFSATTQRSAALVIVGHGPTEPELRALTQTLGIDHRVYFCNWVDDIAPWHNAMDVEVLASTREGLPLGLLEAMACGTFVLSPPVGGVVEYLRHEENGFMTPLDSPEDLVTWLSRLSEMNSHERRKIQLAAKQTVTEGFNPTVGLARMLDVLDASANSL